MNAVGEGSAAPVAVSADGVDMVFNPGTDNEVRALKGIDLEIADREFVSLIGPSGYRFTSQEKFQTRSQPQLRAFVADALGR